MPGPPLTSIQTIHTHPALPAEVDPEQAEFLRLVLDTMYAGVSRGVGACHYGPI
jgi:hypothetical protein